MICMGLKSFLSLQGPVTLEDITVSFTEEEWALLDPVQRALHWEVMKENLAHVVSLGKFSFPL